MVFMKKGISVVAAVLFIVAETTFGHGNTSVVAVTATEEEEQQQQQQQPPPRAWKFSKKQSPSTSWPPTPGPTTSPPEPITHAPTTDFEARRQHYEWNTTDEVLAIVHSHLSKKTTPIILLDVRSPGEVADAHFNVPANKNYRVKYIAGVTMTPDVSSIAQQAATVLPDLSQPIVTFCAVGGRSHLAAQKLLEMGYTTVLNGGGVKDLGYLQQ